MYVYKLIGCHIASYVQLLDEDSRTVWSRMDDKGDHYELFRDDDIDNVFNIVVDYNEGYPFIHSMIYRRSDEDVQHDALSASSSSFTSTPQKHSPNGRVITPSRDLVSPDSESTPPPPLPVPPIVSIIRNLDPRLQLNTFSPYFFLTSPEQNVIDEVLTGKLETLSDEQSQSFPFGSCQIFDSGVSYKDGLNHLKSAQMLGQTEMNAHLISSKLRAMALRQGENVFVVNTYFSTQVFNTLSSKESLRQSDLDESLYKKFAKDYIEKCVRLQSFTEAGKQIDVKKVRSIFIFICDEAHLILAYTF